MSSATPFTIVLGNSKGGTGKSTLAVHLAVALLQAGYRVGAIDLDARQASFSRYLAHRASTAHHAGRPLLLPQSLCLDPDLVGTQSAVSARAALRDSYLRIGAVDIMILDTPGADNEIARAGHALADVLITPVNDSLMDLDILAEIDPAARRVTAPSAYTKRVWELTNLRTSSGQPPIDWLLVRNRLSHSLAHNAQEIDRLLPRLGNRIGFRIASGMRERVIYRELFLDGLTVLDLSPAELSVSRRLARQETIDLVASIGLALPPGTQASASITETTALSSASPAA